MKRVNRVFLLSDVLSSAAWCLDTCESTEEMFDCISITFRRRQLGDERHVHAARAEEQRNVFKPPDHPWMLLCAVLSSSSSSRVKGAVFLRPYSRAQLHPPSHSWPQGAFGSSSTWVCVNECVSVWGLLCRPLPVGSDASQIKFQRTEGIESCFMQRTPGWCSGLNELNWQRDKETITSQIW